MYTCTVLCFGSDVTALTTGRDAVEIVIRDDVTGVGDARQAPRVLYTAEACLAVIGADDVEDDVS